jgi:hypothetical protein
LPWIATRIATAGSQAQQPQGCNDIANGVSPDVERDKPQENLMNQGVTASAAEVGTLVHYALHDLCPTVPNATGI